MISFGKYSPLIRLEEHCSQALSLPALEKFAKTRKYLSLSAGNGGWVGGWRRETENKILINI